MLNPDDPLVLGISECTTPNLYVPTLDSGLRATSGLLRLA